MARLREMTRSMARTRHGIQATDAEDVFQDAVVTYLQIRGRYPPDANHFGLLVSVFELKSREFVSRNGRRGRGLRRLAAHTPRTPVEPPADELAERAETAKAIRDSIAHLAHDARRVLLQLARGRRRRLELIAELGINPNTFDSRLRQARERLRHELAAHGAL
jgi:RNA polymerase sigma factor (sigma-70 family)